MKSRISFFIYIVVFCILLFNHNILKSQNPYHNDKLDKVFYKKRRDALRKIMPKNSVAVFFSNPIRNRSNDVSHVYHQDPNFHYLTGHDKPHSLLLVFKESVDIEGNLLNEVLFVRERDPLMEKYDGNRIDPKDVNSVLGIQEGFRSTLFEYFNLDFAQFNKVLFYDFFSDYRDHQEKGDLFELINHFKRKVGYKKNELSLESVSTNLDVSTLDSLMILLRGIKTKEEISLLRKAVDISSIAQVEVMKAIKPGMSETEIQGLHEYIFKKYRSEYEGYPSIVGAGRNGCVLHYIDNHKPKIEDGELILMDLGAEYHNYTADVTRTIPVNGKFNPEQRLIYDLVYKAQESARKICKSGIDFSELYEVTLDVINEGLVELGIFENLTFEEVINSSTGRHWYYPHGCCHHIGLDVHDKGTYTELKENMVITIEPGIYIPSDSPADEKWWNIAVRIEDDFLINADGCELLSNLAPRSSTEIELMMRKPSAFDDFRLPVLDQKE